jgi:uncharacterized protein (DUF1810 family)
VDGPDRFNLQRFVDAQSDGVYDQALVELIDGRKRSHWMWFIFPQHIDLGRSQTARLYGLTGIPEARAFLDHPLLGERLLACCDAIVSHLLAGTRAEDILGPVDAIKLKSSMEIFAAAGPREYRFKKLLGLLG